MSGFSAQIGANIDNFEKNIAKASRDIDNFSKNVSDKLNKVGDSFIKVGGQLSVFSGAIAGVVAGMGALALSTANYTKDLRSLSVITGASTDTLQEYALITAKATVPTDTLASATLNLQRRLKDTSEEAGGASAILQKLGVSFNNLDGSVKSSSQITEDAIKAFAKLEDGIEKSSLGTQVFGGQWQNIVQIADLGVDAIDSLKQEAHDLGLVLSEEAVTASANFGIAVDVLKLRLTALKNQIGAALAPMLTETLIPIIENKIMPAFQKFAKHVEVLTDKFNNLPDTTKGVIASVTALGVALAPSLLAIGGIIKLLPLLSVGFTALISPVGLVVAAVAGGAVLIAKHWDDIVNYFTIGEGAEVFNTIKNLSQDLLETMKPIWDGIRRVLMFLS